MYQPFARLNRLPQVVRAEKIFGPSVPRPKIRIGAFFPEKRKFRDLGGHFFDLGGGGVGLVGWGEHT